MNQILYSEHQNIMKNKKKRKRSFKFLFYISILSIFCITSYFLYISYAAKQKENLSKNLINSFNLEHLYSQNQEYTTIELNKTGNFFVIGIIEIPKIRIKYPILSDTNDELLKISPCRFYGPYPNEIGNLCIAAHNYDDNRFFGNLDKLNIGDIVNIYNSNNEKVSYAVYDKFEVSESNTTCTSQNTKGQREITLITCNNFSRNRLVVKAKNKDYL